MRVAAVTLGACNAAAGNPQWPVADFLPTEGVHLEHAPLDQPDQAVTLFDARSGTWELREVEGAEPIDVFELDTTDGLAIDGDPILPLDLRVGEAGVTALGEHTTWYGTFPRAVTVEIDGGRWAGLQVFAERLGPVTYTLDGEARDLVFYEFSFPGPSPARLGE